MTLPNLLPRTVNITGADCTGSDGGSNRTYTFPESTVAAYGMNVSVNGATLHEGTSNDFTISSNIITFLNEIWNTSIIRINYFITYGVSPATSLSTTTSLKYATPLMLGEILGLVKDIPSWDVAGSPTLEEVGTGNNSTTIFYLDQKPVISDSYTISYGATASSVTDLTETTHYVLTNDTGKIVLTSAGVTQVGTNKIYATYKYFSNGMNDSYIISVLRRAEKEVDRSTNSIFTDGTQDNPAYPSETEIQASEGIYMDRIITNKKPLIDIETTLDGDHTAAITTISLNAGDSDDYPTSGTIIIGSETISYTGIIGDDLTGCTRGTLGTTAATHSDGDAVHSTVLFRSDTAEGTAVTWTIQPWNTLMYANENGLFYKFKDADPDPLIKYGAANRIKIIYYYGNNTVPEDITRLTLMLAKRMLVQDNVGKSIIAGRNEFQPEMLNADESEIQSIVKSHIVLSMGNT